jgi:nuclear transcription factor Y alpha
MFHRFELPGYGSFRGPAFHSHSHSQSHGHSQPPSRHSPDHPPPSFLDTLDLSQPGPSTYSQPSHTLSYASGSVSVSSGPTPMSNASMHDESIDNVYIHDTENDEDVKLEEISPAHARELGQEEGGGAEVEDGEGGDGEGDDDVDPDADNEEPLYVNAKQYHRILKRRTARARLEELNRLSRSRKVSGRTIPSRWKWSFLSSSLDCFRFVPVPAVTSCLFVRPLG